MEYNNFKFTIHRRMAWQNHSETRLKWQMTNKKRVWLDWPKEKSQTSQQAKRADLSIIIYTVDFLARKFQI